MIPILIIKTRKKMTKSTKILSALSLAAILAVTGCNDDSSSDNNNGSSSVSSTTSSEASSTPSGAISAEQKQAVLAAYADIAYDNYMDAVTAAKALQTALTAFTAEPTEATLAAAKQAWLDSRVSYLQTEIFRLSNGPIDAEEGWVAEAYGALEGQLNAWPLDENMIDYTTDKDGNVTSGNIIDSTGEFTPDGGEPVDVTTITADVLTALNENGGDANVATGYHSIEFLLWGQDQDYASFVADTITNGANVAGMRVVEDYTSNANADRRKAYLTANAEKLVADLEKVTSAWAKTASTDCSADATGCYRGAFLGTLTGADADKNIATDTAISDIMRGMGTFIKSELANERMAVALLTPSEEDEHSCFSDNTHVDIEQDYVGFKNILKATYNGKSYGTSMYSLLSTELKTTIDGLITQIDTNVKAMMDAQAAGTNFDYQIVEAKSTTFNNIKDAKNEMRDLGDQMTKVGTEFGVSVGDVTDPDETAL